MTSADPEVQCIEYMLWYGLRSAYRTSVSRERCVVRVVLNAIAKWCLNKFLAIFCWARSAELTEHPRKVLLRLKATCDRDVQNTTLRHAQHLFAALYPLAQYKLVRALACRFTKHL